ncbi:NAD(P)/FAD-dependent oxidoreductase [Oscillatoriales cyanobacterium LEGE 11467]|uniref:NAD(P)/FAD-dependent oxidoreductase n=1 Tax=Zarconia navalis LEGE 11467 TaxID=1828826 RepID=A0A928VVR7_9CYAN|nr:FAD/NAD(P)-binding oxidoreductase [Zarconia navalis]MBE9041061.1 NAD(P)/FAD-dependent oxidoreductase [Zarconia navalis LEGE 11467]
MQTQSQTPQSTQSNRHHQIVVVGGGTAGITASAQLLASRSSLDIAIVEPSDKHYYQPGWTLVGGGVFEMAQTERNEKDCIPQGVTWIRDSVAKLEPDGNAIVTESGLRVTYDYLILCPGIQINWHLIKGLPEALGKGGVTSNYSKEYAPYTWETLQNFQGGTAIFTFPATPIKCAGAPQKIMYLADDVFKGKSGVGERTQVMFCNAGASMFAVPEYRATLDKIVEERGIQVKFKHSLKEIKPDTREAIFDVTTDGGVEEVSLHYDMIHVAPPMSAPDFIARSPLASPAGWVDVHRETLQHDRYPNVFSLGDASSLPTSKTAAAIRKQAPVLVSNLLAMMDSRSGARKYGGYTCCPLITGYGKTVMAEFDYTLKPTSTFPFDPSQERYSMWVLKKTVLPWVYWNRMLKGKSFEGDWLKFLKGKS